MNMGDTKYYKANELYTICMNSGCEQIPNPVNWVRNKDHMIFMWEKYLIDMNKHPSPYKEMMLDNALTHYMKYMYENY